MTNPNTNEIRESANKGLRGIEWYRPQLFNALDEIDRLKDENSMSRHYIAGVEQRTKEAVWERLEHEIDGRLKYLTPLLFKEVKRAFKQAIESAEIT